MSEIVSVCVWVGALARSAPTQLVLWRFALLTEHPRRRTVAMEMHAHWPTGMRPVAIDGAGVHENECHLLHAVYYCLLFICVPSAPPVHSLAGQRFSRGVVGRAVAGIQ